MRAPGLAVALFAITIMVMALASGCATRHLTEDQEIERGKKAAVTAVQSASAWKRVRGERLTQDELKMDVSRVGHRVYVAQMDTVAYRKGESLLIYTVPTGVQFGMHSTFVDVTVRRDTGEVLAMYESFHP
jgi:hypothetical protein